MQAISHMSRRMRRARSGATLLDYARGPVGQRPKRIAAVIALSALMVTTGAAHASWPSDPTSGLAICSAVGQQRGIQAVGDGTGGAIVTWEDHRNGDIPNVRIYFQHILADGSLAGGLPINGARICTFESDQLDCAIAGDGAGGCFIVWLDSRPSGFGGLYGQHLGANGAPTWAPEGIPIDTTANAHGSSFAPVLLSDGHGGLFVAWTDYRANGLPDQADIYAQRIDSTGAVTWGLHSLGVCTAPGAQGAPVLTTDGADGVIVNWGDHRTGTFPIPYGQRLDRDGQALWATNGVPAVSSASETGYGQGAVTDGAGGCFITWVDVRAFASGEIYAQHLLSTGAIDAAWPDTGLGVWRGSGGTNGASLLPDGAGGVLMAWSSGFSNLWAQRVGSDGAPQWGSNGREVFVPPYSAAGSLVAGDGSGGIILGWHQFGASYPIAIHSHRLDSNGTRIFADTTGVLIASEPAGLALASMIPDDHGGAIFVYQDKGHDPAGDVYAQYMRPDGSLGGDVVPVEASLISADATADGVRLSWYAPVARNHPIALERAVDGAPFRSLATVTVDGTDMVEYLDREIGPGKRYGYRLAWSGASGRVETVPVWVTVPTAPRLSLGDPTPIRRPARSNSASRSRGRSERRCASTMSVGVWYRRSLLESSRRASTS